MTITLILLFLLLSALFSGTEIAFISASKLRVELKRSKGNRQGTILANFYERPARFLATMLVGNNIALVVFTNLTSTMLALVFINYFNLVEVPVDLLTNEAARTQYNSAIERVMGSPVMLLVNTIIITVIVLIFGEFLPKTIFRLFADEVLYWLAYPLRFLQILLLVPAWIMTHLSNRLLRVLFKTPMEEVENVISRVDLENFIKDIRVESKEEEAVGIDTNLFEKALHLKKVKVRECMVPRTEIENIDVRASVEELKQLFMETNLSRIIVTKGDIDSVLGYVHHQQLLQDPGTIQKIVLDIPLVPDSMRVRDLMNLFIKDRINIAWVVDEYGGTAGIITLEDILEEIFGEIEDEHDQEEHIETIVNDNEFLFSGRLEIDYLNEKYEHLNLPGGDYHTLSGYIVTVTETIPKQGAEIQLDDYKFILELVSDTKIELIRVFKLTKEHEEVDQ